MSRALFAVVLPFVLINACDDETPATSSDAPDAAAEDASSVTDASGDARDGGVVRDSASDSDDASISGDALTITDGQGRFTARSFTDYTCPDLPGLGLVVQWVIPQDIAAAVSLPNAAAGAYHLQIEGAASDNVFIEGPPSKKYFNGSRSILITKTGSLPPTTMTAAAPATGTLVVEGTWSCP